MHQIQKDLLALSRNTNLGDKSLRDIGALIGISHPQKISHHLKQLEKKGFLLVDKANNRIVNLNENSSLERSFINIPMVGSANCGPAQLLAVENIESFIRMTPGVLPKGADTKKIFAVQAEGNSMNKASIDGLPIESGDYVLIDGNIQSAEHGDYVLAVYGGAASIKRFHKSPQQISLVSESTEKIHPILIGLEDADDFAINGRVLKVIKQPTFA